MGFEITETFDNLRGTKKTEVLEGFEDEMQAIDWLEDYVERCNGYVWRDYAGHYRVFTGSGVYRLDVRHVEYYNGRTFYL